MIENKDAFKAICMKILQEPSRVIVSKEQAHSIYYEALGKKHIPEHQFKIFETSIKTVIASHLLEKTIKSTAVHIWKKRKEFECLRENEKVLFEELLKCCGNIYGDFPEFFDPINRAVAIVGNSEAATKPYLTALAFFKDRIVASGFLQRQEHDLVDLKEDYSNAAVLSLNVKAFNGMFAFDNGLNSAKADEYIGNIFDENKEDPEQYIHLGDITLKESSCFEHYEARLKNTISSMQNWRTLEEYKREKEIEEFMTQIFEIHLNFFQNFSSSECVVDILSPDDKKIIIDNLNFIQKDYVADILNVIVSGYEIEFDIENYITPYIEDCRTWSEELSLTRSKIESFNCMFNKIAKLEKTKIIEFMIRSAWALSQNTKDRPEHIPATHWWWFT